MLELKNISIKIKERYLIKNLNLTLNKGDKLAIIGEEGNGKSTLLKAILNKCDYATITGNINFHNYKIGYLEQSINNEEQNKTVFNYLFLNTEDYYNKINNLYKYLEILKLNDQILEQILCTLSGGEKIKINLLKILLEENDILFLDEPTNDLDIKTLEWLENFLLNCHKSIIYISHDETLLAKTANMILHLEQIKNKTDCRHTILKTDYESYITARLKKIAKETQVAKFEKREHNKKELKLQQVMNKVAHEQSTISRSNPHGAKMLKKKMHSLKSQEKKLEQDVLTEIPDVEEGINFFFSPINIPNNKTIINLTLNELIAKNRVLAKDINLEVVGNEHICIIGDNGIGKSTLIKEIYHKLQFKTDIKVGYMPQNYNEILKEYPLVLDFISPTKNKEEITRARTILGNMKLTNEEMLSPINNLSNGTKAKIFLAKLVLDQNNVLILDEPTRNVSPLSNHIIRQALKEFAGTIISVSHDRKYIEEVIDTIYLLSLSGLKKINK